MRVRAKKPQEQAPMFERGPQIRPLARAIVALCFTTFCAGCTLFSPTERTIDREMTVPTKGRVVRDQYGQHVVVGEPSLYERNQAMLDAASSIMPR